MSSQNDAEGTFMTGNVYHTHDAPAAGLWYGLVIIKRLGHIDLSVLGLQSSLFSKLIYHVFFLYFIMISHITNETPHCNVCV